MNTKAFFPCGRVKLNFKDRYGKLNIFSKNSSRYQVFFTKFSKIVTGVKKNHYPPRWIGMTHIQFPTLFPRSIIIFQGVLRKSNFLIKFLCLEKFVNLMKDTKAFFLCGGGSNLIWGTDSENQIFFSKNSS